MLPSCPPGNAHSTQHLHRASGAAAPTLAIIRAGEQRRECCVRERFGLCGRTAMRFLEVVTALPLNKHVNVTQT